MFARPVGDAFAAAESSRASLACFAANRLRASPRAPHNIDRSVDMIVMLARVRRSLVRAVAIAGPGRRRSADMIASREYQLAYLGENLLMKHTFFGDNFVGRKDEFVVLEMAISSCHGLKRL